MRRGTIAVAVAAITVLAGGVMARDADSGPRVIAVSTRGDGVAHERITLSLDKAAIVQLDSDARDVLVSNPDVVDAVVRTPRRIFLLAQKIGQTNAFFFDGHGRQLLSIDIRVERDVTDLLNMLRMDMPGSQIKVAALNDNVVLTGSVENAQDSTRAQELAGRFVGDSAKVVNMLKIGAGEQVMLKVRVAEVSRTIAKQFGIDLSSAAVAAGVPIIAGTSNPFGLVGRALADASGAQIGSVCAGAFTPNTVTQIVSGATAATVAATSALTGLASSSSTSSALNGGLSGTTNLSGTATGAMHWVIDPATGLPVYTQNLASDLSPSGSPTGSANFGATGSQSASGSTNTSTNATNTVSNGTNYSSTRNTNIPCTSPNNLQGVVKALEQVGLMHTLAEPNLIAVSGETAKFLAGGEFPVPSGRDTSGNVSVQFKKFGVGLSFTPIVMSPNRISLQVSTEVSELTNTGAFTIAGGTVTGPNGQAVSTGLTIPALAVRRAETTIELPSGGSFAIAGLMQHATKQVLDSFPGLKDMPVLGALFRSRDYQANETELVVMVSAYLVNPVAPDKISLPTDGFVPATDPETILLGKLNETHKVADGTLKSADDGKTGFIVQ